MPPSAVHHDPNDRPRWWTGSRAKVAIKSTLGALVLVMVAQHATRTWVDLQARGASIRIAPGAFLASMALYLGGLLPFGLFYRRALLAGGSTIRPYPATRAYLVSHLGKYVPGKAMVVVVRAGLSAPHGARASTAAFASIYETLLMMAVGGLVAAAGFSLSPSRGTSLPIGIGGRSITLPLPLIGLGLGFGFSFLSSPWAFPRLARLAKRPLPGVGLDSLPRITPQLVGEGVAWNIIGWTLLGLSQVALLASMIPGGLEPSAWPAVVASVALATVAGFVVPIAPGGLGVREWVLWTALAATIDRDLAVVAALALRLAWVLAEVGAGAALMAIRPKASSIATGSELATTVTAGADQP